MIIVRGVQGWVGELAAGDPRQVLEAVARHCRRAARLGGADPEAVWQWAFTELVSTGLFLLHLGHHEEAGTFLTAAGKLAAATANGQPGPARQAGPGDAGTVTGDACLAAWKGCSPWPPIAWCPWRERQAARSGPGTAAPQMTSSRTDDIRDDN